MAIEVLQIATDQIKFFLRRSRADIPYRRLKESIREVGLKTPVGVRDISDRPKKARERPQGGYYKYELVYGQGRLQAFRDLEISHIPAVVVIAGEEEIVGRFLAENVMRRQLSWQEKADLIRRDVEEHALDAKQIAERYFLSVSQATKYLRIVQGASDRVRSMAERGELSVDDADKLMQLNQAEQDIVIEVIDEQKLDKSAVYHLVDEANKLKQKGKVTKESLSSSLADLNKDIRVARDRYKLKRLEYALGPGHLYELARDPEFCAMAENAGLNLSNYVAGSSGK